MIDWLIEGAPPARLPQDVLLHLCRRLVAQGMPLYRVAVFVRTPIRKAPSIGPYTIDAIVKPTVKTEPQPRARIAMAISTTPHTAVSQREILNKRRSSPDWRPTNG